MCETLGKMTNLSEKFCLKWDDFQQNLVTSYHDLRKDPDFCDVTLVCEEDQQIETHIIILAACSPFFRTVLKKNKHSHPVIYMRGLKAKDLVAIVDFIYHGEANVHQEDLDGFLALAEELQLKGLDRAQDETLDTYQEPTRPKQSKFQRKPIPEQEEFYYKPQMSEESDTNIINTFEEYLTVPVDAVNSMSPLDTNKEDHKVKLDSMMVKAKNGEYTCKVCGKAFKKPAHMREHVETHIEGLSYPCNQCGKVSR